MNDTFGIESGFGICRAPLGLGQFVIRRSQGGARCSLALGWLVGGPLALASEPRPVIGTLSEEEEWLRHMKKILPNGPREPASACPLFRAFAVEPVRAPPPRRKSPRHRHRRPQDARAGCDRLDFAIRGRGGQEKECAARKFASTAADAAVYDREDREAFAGAGSWLIERSPFHAEKLTRHDHVAMGRALRHHQRRARRRPRRLKEPARIRLRHPPVAVLAERAARRRAAGTHRRRHPATYLTLSFRRQIDADDLIWHVLFSADLASWTEDGVLVSSTPNGDGTATELWRSAAPVAADAKGFARVRVDGP